MLTIGFFIEGGEIDQPIIMRQWQLCQEAYELSNCRMIVGMSTRCHMLIYRRLRRRMSVMKDLINAYNEAQEIYRQHGRQIKAAILAAL